jgi:hypothetical protein
MIQPCKICYATFFDGTPSDVFPITVQNLDKGTVIGAIQSVNKQFENIGVTQFTLYIVPYADVDQFNPTSDKVRFKGLQVPVSIKYVENTEPTDVLVVVPPANGILFFIFYSYFLNGQLLLLL